MPPTAKEWLLNETVLGTYPAPAPTCRGNFSKSLYSSEPVSSSEKMGTIAFSAESCQETKCDPLGSTAAHRVITLHTRTPFPFTFPTHPDGRGCAGEWEFGETTNRRGWMQKQRVKEWKKNGLDMEPQE